MAEAFLRDIVKKDSQLREHFSIASSGIAALEGEGASKHAVTAMKKKWGINIENHQASLLNEQSLKEAFLVLTMTISQKNFLVEQFPWAADKIFTIYSYTEPEHSRCNVADPFGMPLSEYVECAKDIKNMVNKIAQKLREEIE